MTLPSSSTPLASVIRQYLEQGLTGRLSVREADGGWLMIYVMQGEILAAESRNDGPAMLRCLHNAGALSRREVEQLSGLLKRRTTIGDLLFGRVPDEVVLSAFHERFIENLARFVMTPDNVAFEALESIFVENVQVGHDSRELIDWVESWVGEVAQFLAQDLDQAVVPGACSPASTQDARILELVGSASTARAILDSSPYERVHTCHLVFRMLATGLLMKAPVAEPRSESILLGTPAVPPLPDPTVPIPALDVSGPGAVPDEEAGHGPDAAIPAPEAQETPCDDHEGLVSGDMRDVARRFWTAMRGATNVVPDTEHPLFGDAERRRGGGEFIVERRFLDVVDLSSNIPDEDDEEDDANSSIACAGLAGDQEVVIEAEDQAESHARAVTLSFNVPPLTGDEAIAKIEVCNRVLKEISRALDQENGPGSGQAGVQLLFEGAPGAFATVFYGVEARRDGSFLPDAVIRNLFTRAERERRSLLNQALHNLVERGLSVAADTVSGESLDELLVRIAGFQQRLGF